MLKAFPLLIVSVIFYNLLVYAGLWFVPTGDTVNMFLARDMFAPTMFSGEIWHFRISDFIIFITIAFLFVEMVKATDTTSLGVINHGLSAVVFVIALLEFITLPRFATSAFFFITMMALVDVIAGFTISIVAAKRDLGTAGGLIGTN